MRPLRVLYAPRNIAGQAEMYARSIRALGHHAEVWSYGPPAFGFGADRVIDERRVAADPEYRWSLLDEAVRNFDVFHFQYGRSLLLPQLPEFPPLGDLPLLASLGKRVVMNFRGSDVRLRSVHIAREPDSYMHDPSVVCDEERIVATVATSRRFCDAMLVSTPGLVDYVPDARWLPHVVDADWWARPDEHGGAERAVPVVVHLPSRRATKSSDAVERATRALHDEGVIEYRPLQDLDREQVRAAFWSADVVVDSLGIGDHGLVSVEAMAAGAIAVAHIHPRNRERNPGVPVVEATVHDLAEVLRSLAADRERRTALRLASVAWVRAHHTLEVAGPLLADLYRRPSGRPGLSDPEYPIVADSRRVRDLEREVETLRVELAARGDRRLVERSAARKVADWIRGDVRVALGRLSTRIGLTRVVGGVRRRARQWRVVWRAR